ncbi:unnamed protein product, partial [Candidula unifasciata]
IDYKTRKLRHPIRHVDEQEALIKLEMKNENDKKKFNKKNKDFIQTNKECFKMKDAIQHPPPGNTHIKPGTVTLTQEQLAALLASLRTTTGNNKTDVQNHKANSNGDDEDGFTSDSGIDVLLNEVRELAKSHPRKTTDRNNGNKDSQVMLGHEQKSHAEPGQKILNSESPQQSQQDSVSNMVPFKHLSVAEKKRLQWARERAETQEAYDPWGRPGAGAPMKKTDVERKHGSHDDKGNISLQNKSADYKQQQNLLLNEIEKLQQGIREAEFKKWQEDEKQKSLMSKKSSGEEQNRITSEKRNDPQSLEEAQMKTGIRAQNGQQLNQDIVAHDKASTNPSKKEVERQQWLAELDKQRQEQQLRKQKEKEQDRQGIHDSFADRFGNQKTAEHISPRREQTGHKTTSINSGLSKVPDSILETNIPPAAMRSAMGNGAVLLNEAKYENVKAEEKRRWLEELDRQREEQRMAKLAQKEKDRQDSGMWVDHYPVDHEKLRQAHEILQNQHVSPRERNYLSTQRTNSAPQATVEDFEKSSATLPTFLRGQGAIVDPVTRREQEEKKRIQMEYQAQVKAQIEERERQKRENRERKLQEDMEEDKRLQMERDYLNRQLEMEQTKTKTREELRQRQMAVLKSALDEAQGKALEAKNDRRIHHLQQRGHDISQLKAAYEASIPQTREYETSQNTGQGIESLRGYQAYMNDRNLTSTYNIAADTEQFGALGSHDNNQPYVENRLLTPSTYRNPSKPRHPADSPRREFGTQTLELKELQAILQSLPEDIQIQYKMRVEDALQEKERRKQAPTRKVHAKNASEDSNSNKNSKGVQPKEIPQKLENKPQWNQKKRKTAVKNSEKDPYYFQKRQEAELRKERREQKLLYLQELNKDRIPMHSNNHDRPHCEFAEDVQHIEEKSGKVVATNKTRPSESPENTGGSSPPIPAVRHRTTMKKDDGKDPYQYANNYLQMSPADSKYGDAAVFPSRDEFVPFMRTAEILDPSKADEPLVVSRENSHMERARNAYFELHHPANRGKRLDVYRDQERESSRQ